MLPKEEKGADRIAEKEPEYKTNVRTGRQLESQIAIRISYSESGDTSPDSLFACSLFAILGRTHAN